MKPGDIVYYEDDLERNSPAIVKEVSGNRVNIQYLDESPIENDWYDIDELVVGGEG